MVVGQAETSNHEWYSWRNLSSNGTKPLFISNSFWGARTMTIISRSFGLGKLGGCGLSYISFSLSSVDCECDVSWFVRYRVKVAPRDRRDVTWFRGHKQRSWNKDAIIQLNSLSYIVQFIQILNKTRIVSALVNIKNKQLENIWRSDNIPVEDSTPDDAQVDQRRCYGGANKLLYMVVVVVDPHEWGVNPAGS